MSRINVLNATDDGRLKRFVNTLQQCSQPNIHTRNEGDLQQSTEQKNLRLTTTTNITVFWHRKTVNSPLYGIEVLHGTAAMLHGRNNRLFFLWEKMFLLMQNIFIVPSTQHGCRVKPLKENQAKSRPVKHHI